MAEDVEDGARCREARSASGRRRFRSQRHLSGRAGRAQRVDRHGRRGPRPCVPVDRSRTDLVSRRHADRRRQLVRRHLLVGLRRPRRGIAVGGDYRKEEDPGDNIAMSDDGGATWATPGAARLRSFRSGVAFVPGTDGRLVVAVGPAGTDWSADGGRSWTPLSGIGFHAVGVDPGGRVGWAVWRARKSRATFAGGGRGLANRSLGDIVADQEQTCASSPTPLSAVMVRMERTICRRTAAYILAIDLTHRFTAAKTDVDRV